ncbi:unnamed protein product [Prunus armeniaca]
MNQILLKQKEAGKDLRAERSWREKNTKVGVVMGVENMDKHTTKGTVLCFKNHLQLLTKMLLMAWIIVLRHRMISFLDDVLSSSDSTYFLEGARTWLVRCLQQHKMCILFGSNSDIVPSTTRKYLSFFFFFSSCTCKTRLNFQVSINCS